jgi:RNA polymerase sigma-70 factor (ECF subfamily)
MDYTTLDDSSLIRLIAHSRSEALSALYDRYSRLVFSIAYNSLHDQGLAEEVVQDVFTRVWEKAVTYEANLAKVSTWLITITRNRAIDELRRIKVRPEANQVGWDDLTENIIPHSDVTESMVEMSLQQKQVRHALAALPEEQRKALALAYFQGLSHSEIAAELNEPVGTIKTRIRLAMQKLRQILGEEIASDR